MITTAYLQGLGTGAGLIIAIGAQNAFVLTQSLARNHHLLFRGFWSAPRATSCLSPWACR